jgi:nanoRNase/pAp phosphatase (c-di-AMP/oligoRNAs hydrolase)
MANTSIKVSLRSLGDEDTTVITQAHGGGGHKNASSCVMLLAEFERWKA